MKFDLHDEIWLFILGGVVLAAAAAGIAFWLTSGGTVSGLTQGS